MSARRKSRNGYGGCSGPGLLDLIVIQPGWARSQRRSSSARIGVRYAVCGERLSGVRQSLAGIRSTVDADNVESMKIYAGGIPAEFGQKLGGVVEVNTQRNISPGFHGTAVLQGGSFATAGAFLSGQYVAGRTTATVSAEGFLTDHYLDPPVTENYTNHASNHVVQRLSRAGHRRCRPAARSVDRREVWFQVPDDLLQQRRASGKIEPAQDTEGQLYYQHVFRRRWWGRRRNGARPGCAAVVESIVDADFGVTGPRLSRRLFQSQPCRA